MSEAPTHSARHAASPRIACALALLAASPASAHIALLAQSKRDLTPIMLWLGVLVAIVIGGGLAILWYRRAVLGKDSPDHADQGLMANLRALRDSGKITTEEFDAMRKSMVRKAAARHIPGDAKEPKPKPVRTVKPSGTQPPAAPPAGESR